MLGLMKFKKLFWKKSDEHDKLDELDHEFIAGFTKREIIDRKSTRLNSSHWKQSRMPSSA